MEVPPEMVVEGASLSDDPGIRVKSMLGEAGLLQVPSLSKPPLRKTSAATLIEETEPTRYLVASSVLECLV
jgi:hypothetical protein